MTDDKRIEEIRARYAVTWGAHAADIAFLVGKIAEYEARGGAADAQHCTVTTAWGEKGYQHCVRPKFHQGDCELSAPYPKPMRVKSGTAAPPPQVREAEAERPKCPYCPYCHENAYVENPNCDCWCHLTCEEGTAAIKIKVSDRERTAREEGVKRWVEAAAG